MAPVSYAVCLMYVVAQPKSKTHMILLSGVFVGGVKVLARYSPPPSPPPPPLLPNVLVCHPSDLAFLVPRLDACIIRSATHTLTRILILTHASTMFDGFPPYPKVPP
jgi:hypothetical protein